MNLEALPASPYPRDSDDKSMKHGMSLHGMNTSQLEARMDNTKPFKLPRDPVGLAITKDSNIPEFLAGMGISLDDIAKKFNIKIDIV